LLDGHRHEHGRQQGPGVRAALVRDEQHRPRCPASTTTPTSFVWARATPRPRRPKILDVFLAPNLKAAGTNGASIKWKHSATPLPSAAAIGRSRNRQRHFPGTQRQQENIELIASENFVSPAVMEAQGSVLTNKYAEGYPGKRWYGGCENVDVIERLAIERAKKIFGAEHANVQPHSGSQANMAVYFSVLKPGDKMLTMDLSTAAI
jgi:hypothetical protein